jgi:translation elongation factor EF-1alpha
MKGGIVMIFGLFGRKKEKQAEEVLVGSVIHFFPHVKVAVIKVDQGSISVGDVIRIKGHTSDFRQKIKSMEIEHETMDSVSKGQEVAIKVKKRARIGDQVFMPRG